MPTKNTIKKKQDAECNLNDVVKLTGLELLQAFIAGKLAIPPISKLIPMGISHLEAGHIFISAKSDAKYLNTIGTVHGGFTATILGSATGSAVQSTLNAGEIYSTI